MAPGPRVLPGRQPDRDGRRGRHRPRAVRGGSELETPEATVLIDNPGMIEGTQRGRPTANGSRSSGYGTMADSGSSAPMAPSARLLVRQHQLRGGARARLVAGWDHDRLHRLADKGRTPDVHARAVDGTVVAARTSAHESPCCIGDWKAPEWRRWPVHRFGVGVNGDPRTWQAITVRTAPTSAGYRSARWRPTGSRSLAR